MNAAYSIKHTSNGWALVLNFANGDGALVGYYPTRNEARDTLNALNTLRS